MPLSRGYIILSPLLFSLNNCLFPRKSYVAFHSAVSQPPTTAAGNKRHYLSILLSLHKEHLHNK